MNDKKNRIVFVVSHPTQYQSPLSRLISQSEDLGVDTLFYWNKKPAAHFDVGFGQKIQWDVPLLSGYDSEYLADRAKSTSVFSKLIALWKIISSKQHDIVWAHGYTDLYTLFSIVSAKLNGLKVFVRGDSVLFPDTKNYFLKKLKRKIFFWFLNKFVDRYLAVGTLNKNFYLAFGIPKEKIFLCGYAVDNDLFRKNSVDTNKTMELKKSLGLDLNRPVILYAGKFTEQKCVVDLIDAYILLSQNREEPRPYLLLIGTGEKHDVLVSKLSGKNWNSVKFLGFKNQTELPGFYAIADILVSLGVHEKWGLVVNEAMNAECAIIISDHLGCSSDLVKQGLNGFIYPARDIKTLVHYLKILIEDPVLCEKMKIKSGEIISHWGLRESVYGLRAACESLNIVN